MPLCPETSVVAETYPAAALVVSDGTALSFRDAQYAAQVVTKYLKAQPEKSPLFVLPVADETMKTVLNEVDKLEGTPEQKARWKSQIVQVKGDSYPWQQDYFEGFANPQTGALEVREVQRYGQTETFNAIAKELGKCGIQTGKVLANRDGVSGTYGGNIEALPGGVCIVGNDGFESKQDWSDYVSQFCGTDESLRIEVPTYFMTVGHTDEIVKVLPSNKETAPCNFAISIASPAKALELLKAKGKDRFLSDPDQILPSFRVALNRGEGKAMKVLCRAIKGKVAVPPVPRWERGVSFIEWLTLSKSAYADYQDACASITNAEVVNAVNKDKQIKEFNEGIQKEMNQLKVTIAQKLKRKMPQCHVDFIDVPNLFIGGAAIKGEARPLSAGMADSILPNPTNSMSAGDTVVTPEPHNKAFKNYIAAEYGKRGIKSDFINTYTYAHVGGGNLHCTTHTIHACQGRGVK